MNIYQKMSAVTAEIARVPKNLTVGTGKSQYKAVAEGDILSAVKKAESAVGIFSYPSERKVIESRISVVKNDYGERENQFIRIETTYRFVNIEQPEEYVEVKAYGDGFDALDKAPGKAVTYADKYALMKAYKIETGEDVDRIASDDLEGHDIMKIKQRTERVITAKLQKGMDFRDILAHMGMSERQFNDYMQRYSNLAAFEAKLRQA